MKIGLSYTGDEKKHSFYVNWLKGDDDITILRLSAEESNADLLKECDALVLSGGVDIHPGLTRGRSDYPNKPERWQPDRDLFEKSLYEKALSDQLPVLGICRGMQLVNVLQGGTLIEDVGSGNEKHKKEGGADKEHTLTIRENTLLEEIVQTRHGEINSAHHQAIGELGNGLQVNSIADDGTIEGLEWNNKEKKPFLLGVQWHPERMFQNPGSPLSRNIRNYFIGEIKRSIAIKNENN